MRYQQEWWPQVPRELSSSASCKDTKKTLSAVNNSWEAGLLGAVNLSAARATRGEGILCIDYSGLLYFLTDTDVD